MLESKIRIESFDNGITWKEKTKYLQSDGEIGDVFKVIYDEDKQKVIGEMIWNDVEFLMNMETANKVELEIKIKVIEG